MKIREFVLRIEEYASPDDLPGSDRDLLRAASDASQRSYSPYSEFRVGAAVRLRSGLLVTGNNQENAAYPSGLCAERVALFAAQSQYPDQAVDAIAIFASTGSFDLKEPVTPCGSCRQVIAEYEYRHRQPSRIIMGNGQGKVQVANGIENLLPLVFYLEELKKHRSV
jgi:cytidine deaminase